MQESTSIPSFKQAEIGKFQARKNSSNRTVQKAIQNSCQNSLIHYCIMPQFFIFKKNEDINPTRASHRGMNPDHYDLAQKELAQLQQEGIIEPTTSQWACEAFYVNKRTGSRQIQTCHQLPAISSFFGRWQIPSYESGYTLFPTLWSPNLLKVRSQGWILGIGYWAFRTVQKSILHTQPSFPMDLNALFFLFKNQEETPLHVLRDCDQAKDLWNLIGIPVTFKPTLQMPLVEWLRSNCLANFLANQPGLNWKILFPMMCNKTWFVHKDLSLHFFESLYVLME